MIPLCHQDRNLLYIVTSVMTLVLLHFLSVIIKFDWFGTNPWILVCSSIRNIEPAICITDQSSQIPNVFERFRLNVEFTVHRLAPHLKIESTHQIFNCKSFPWEQIWPKTCLGVELQFKEENCSKTWFPSPTLTFPSQSVQPQCLGDLVLSCLDRVWIFEWFV